MRSGQARVGPLWRHRRPDWRDLAGARAEPTEELDRGDWNDVGASARSRQGLQRRLHHALMTRERSQPDRCVLAALPILRKLWELSGSDSRGVVPG